MNAKPRHAATNAPRSRRASKVVRLALAGIALAGIGAAATSAAWNDSAYFSGTVNSAKVDLQGRMQGSSTWLPADSTGTAVPLGAVTGLVPGNVTTKTIQLWNAGTAPLKLTWATAPTSLVDPSCYTVAYSTLPTNLPGDPGAGAASITTATITITLLSTAPQATCANQTATLTVVVQGSTL